MFTIPIRKKWFDMIRALIKKEEYREIKYYWAKRLMKQPFTKEELSGRLIKPGFYEPKHRIIRLRNGYNPSSPAILVEIRALEVKVPNPEWCDNWTDLAFALHLLRVQDDPTIPLATSLSHQQ